jgi:hypothetical protein
MQVLRGTGVNLHDCLQKGADAYDMRNLCKFSPRFEDWLGSQLGDLWTGLENQQLTGCSIARVQNSDTDDICQQCSNNRVAIMLINSVYTCWTPAPITQ